MKIVDPKTVIEESIRKIVGPDVSFVVEHPKEESHGDFASNVALAAYTKFSKENPRKLADELVSMLKNDTQLSSVVNASEISVAGPGFINFWLSKEWLTNELKNIITSGDNYGKDDSGKGKKVLVEYSSPNIAKQFSIGHLRSTIIGQ
ncbi:MAG: arginine--tRNA ligase, partial [Ignavibacteria bacterium]|nr:arginine--tRNA ligase [Ignavibacteria bacterium]